MQDLKITLVQTELTWEDIPANLSMLEKKLDTIQEETDLVVLPEMFSTGFSMNAQKLAQDMDGSAVMWLLNQSEKRSVDITGSVIIKDGEHYFNRLIWAKPDRSIRQYDKKHLFRMSGEDKVYHEGNAILTVDLKGWRIRPFICYDLRFPAWTRNSGHPYDIALYTANWPAVREEQWEILLQARAIENQSYVIGVNRVGKDGNDIDYSGRSSVIDPLGHILFQKKDLPWIHTQSLSYSFIKEYRESFPAWMDRDTEIDRLFQEIPNQRTPAEPEV
jgi:predicted amidohydrolase